MLQFTTMQMPDETTTLPPRRIILWKMIKIIAWFLPSVIAVEVAIFFYVQWQQAEKLVGQSPAGKQDQTISRDEIEKTVRELSEIVLLPEGELPTLSTITDIKELTENKDFFANAQNGDKVLMYQQAKKAFLYRPSTQKLINLAPVNIEGTSQEIPSVSTSEGEEEPSESSPTPEPAEETEPLAVVLRNGTPKQGLTYDFEPKLLSAIEQAEVIARDNAAQDDYAETVVVVVNLTKQSTAQKLAIALGVTLSDLPAGELAGEADVLIILGADQL